MYENDSAVLPLSIHMVVFFGGKTAHGEDLYVINLYTTNLYTTFLKCVNILEVCPYCPPERSIYCSS